MYFRFIMGRLNEGAKYRIACYSNDKVKTFVPTNYRGDLNLCIQVYVKNNLGYVEFLVNDFGRVECWMYKWKNIIHSYIQ